MFQFDGLFQDTFGVHVDEENLPSLSDVLQEAFNYACLTSAR